MYGSATFDVTAGWTGAGLEVNLPFSIISYISYEINATTYRITRVYLSDLSPTSFHIQCNASESVRGWFVFSVAGKWK